MKMTTVEKLEKAQELIKRAEKLVRQARIGNKSLKSFYGYNLEITENRLNVLSDNSGYYASKDVSLKEMIESEGEDWQNK